MQDIADHASLLPLQQGMSAGSYAFDNKVHATVIGAHDDGRSIHVRAGIFFTTVIAGCNCADDPSPIEEQNEYCIMNFVIDKKTAKTTVTLA
jgi:hypothetical protein